jgi:glycosyltransferase involved in cell wall biosynthesis
MGYDILVISRYNPNKRGGLEQVVRTQLFFFLRNNLKVGCLYRDSSIQKIQLKNVDQFVILDRISKFSGALADIIYSIPMYLKASTIPSRIILDNFDFTCLLKFFNLFHKRESIIMKVHHGTPNYLDSYTGPKGILGRIYKLSLTLINIFSSKVIDLNVAVSQKVKEELVKHYHFLPNKIVVIQNAVDTNRFRPRSKILARKRFGFSLSSKIILFVGGDLYRKNFFKALEYFMILKKHIPNLFFVVVTSERYKKKLESLKIGGLIVFSNIPDNEIPYLYNAADVLLLPSRYEALPLTLLESLSSSCPAVVSSNSAEKKFNGKGYLIAYNKEEFIKYCMRLLTEETYYKIMQRRARELVEKYYDIRRQEKKYLRILKNINYFM